MSTATATRTAPRQRPATAQRHLSVVRESAAISRAPGSAGVRLTRRGRLVLLLVTALAALLALAWGAQAVGASSESEGPATAYVKVEAGDSLWSIARDLAPSSDTRDVVARISDLNDLDSADLRAGQLLVVPARAA